MLQWLLVCFYFLYPSSMLHVIPITSVHPSFDYHLKGLNVGPDGLNVNPDGMNDKFMYETLVPCIRI